MTFLAHAALSYLECDLIGLPWYCSTVAAGIGAYPDIRAMPETTKGNWTGIYEQTHKLSLITWLLPFLAQHILIDKLWHKPEGKWHWWGIPAEIFFWICFLMCMYFKHF